jgi:hypothetical protein
MVREEFIAFAELHTPRIPGVFYPPSSAEPSPPSTPPRSGQQRSTSSQEPFVGCIVNSVEELRSWVVDNMPRMIDQGRRFSTAVYIEMRRTLEEEPPGKRHTVAIIPLACDDDDAEMRRMVNLFFETFNARQNRAARVRKLFDHVQVLIGDFDYGVTSPRGYV